MAKKTKSKARLDKFYKIAKEQGYRSRASFKLIQLNAKYNFLQNSKVLIDLCAAPGGWMQVAAKYMSPSSIILGFDLDPIKPIANTKSYQCDITSAKCLSIIKKEIRHLKVDVVLNDGAPNVGGDWSKDAFGQSELVIYSVKLACSVLKKGGTFITKVFRSADYNSLIWLLNNFFEKVEANKPEASRLTSAEIFLVCLDYKEPSYIDPKFFEIKYIFKNNESDFGSSNQTGKFKNINSIFDSLKAKREFDQNATTNFRKIDLQDFINSDNPYSVLAEYNTILLPDDLSDLKLEIPKFPDDLEDMCSDLKLLNKKQISSLIKWRAKIIDHRKSVKKTNDSIRVSNETKDVKSENTRNSTEKEQNKNILKYLKKVNNESKGCVGGEELLELDSFNFDKYANKLRKGDYIEVNEEDESEGNTAKYKKNKIEEIDYNLNYNYDRKNKIAEKETNKPKMSKTKVNEGNWYDNEIFNIVKPLTYATKELNIDDIEVEESAKEEEEINERAVVREFNKDDTNNRDLNQLYRDKNREMDIDEMAEIVAISKKMLRKKTRLDILADNYKNDSGDYDNLPKWFVEDEKKVNVKRKIVTNEEILAEKERLEVLGNKLPKKVMEAKARKKKKMISAMKKAKTESNVVLENEGLSHFTKARSINKIYKKALSKGRDKKMRTIVMKKHSVAAPNKKSGRKFRIVDSRMKKDFRNKKINKKNKFSKKK